MYRLVARHHLVFFSLFVFLTGITLLVLCIDLSRVTLSRCLVCLSSCRASPSRVFLFTHHPLRSRYPLVTHHPLRSMYPLVTCHLLKKTYDGRHDDQDIFPKSSCVPIKVCTKSAVPIKCCSAFGPAQYQGAIAPISRAARGWLCSPEKPCTL